MVDGGWLMGSGCLTLRAAWLMITLNKETLIQADSTLLRPAAAGPRGASQAVGTDGKLLTQIRRCLREMTNCVSSVCGGLATFTKPEAWR